MEDITLVMCQENNERKISPPKIIKYVSGKLLQYIFKDIPAYLFMYLFQYLTRFILEFALQYFSDCLIKNIRNLIRRLYLHKLHLKGNKSDITKYKDTSCDGFVLHKLPVYNSMNLCIVKLPHGLDFIKSCGGKRVKKISKATETFCKVNNLQNCILTDALSDSGHFDYCRKGIFNGQYLYKSLLNNILDEIYTKRGIIIRSLDIVVIRGENDFELLNTLRLLSERVKYITVISEESAGIEGEFDAILSNSGLSIVIARKSDRVIKNADLIINLLTPNSETNFQDISTKTLIQNIRAKTLIIDYALQTGIGYFDAGILIRGVETVLPVNILKQIDTAVYNFFSMTAVSEMLLCYKLNIGNSLPVKASDLSYETMKSISEEFKRDGFRFGRFVGRHGQVALDEIVIK